MRRPLATAACALAAFAAGYAFTRTPETPVRDRPAGTPSPRKDSGLREPVRIEREYLPAAISEMARRPESLARDHDLFTALESMTAEDFKTPPSDFTSLCRVFDTLRRSLRSSAKEAAMERWLAVDPESALRWIEGAITTPKDPAYARADGHEPSVTEFLPLAAEHDPEWLRAMALRVPDAKTQTHALRVLMEAVASRNPAQAREWMAELPEGPANDAAFDGMIRGLAKSDPHLAAGIALGMTNPKKRSDALAKLVEHSAELGASTVAEVLARIDDPAAKEALVWTAIQTLAMKTNVDLIAFLDSQVPREKAGSMTNIRSWILAEREPERAADWAASLDGPRRDYALSQIVRKWAGDDPAAAMKWLAQQPADKLPGAGSLSGAMHSLAASARDEFERWAATLPEGDLRNRANLQLAGLLASSGDTSGAIRMVREVTNRPDTVEALRNFAMTLPAEEHASITRWLTALPPGETQESAIGAYMWNLIPHDPKAAAAWVDTLPGGAARDAAAAAMAGSLARANPAAAAQWVAGIAKPEHYTKSAGAVFEQWYKSDPASASGWLRSLPGLDEAERTRLLRGQP